MDWTNLLLLRRVATARTSRDASDAADMVQ